MPPESVEAELAADIKAAELGERIQGQFSRRMTWGEFKSAVESGGVADDHQIFMIDIHVPDAEEPLLVRPDDRKSRRRGLQVSMQY